jgi:protein-disulfide isomerase
MSSSDLFKLAAAMAAGAVVAWAASQGLADRNAARLDALEAGQRAILDELKTFKEGPRPSAAAPPANQPSPMELPKAPLSIAGAAMLGRADAPLTLVEFSDFQCPFCLRHVQQTFDKIKASYVDTGKVRYVFRHFPIQSLHPQAWTGARAADCAGQQGKFWEFHRTLFANPKRMSETDVEGYARAEKLDVTAFKNCIANPDVTAKIRKDLEEGSRAGVTGTPMFFVGSIENGKVKVAKRLNGAVSFELFQQIIDPLLASPPSTSP